MGRIHTQLLPRGDMLAHHTIEKVEVAPQRTIRQHHALGEAGGTAGIVDERHVFGIAVVIGHMLATEELGELAAKHLVEMLTCIGELLGTREREREVGQIEHAFQCGHLRSVYLRSHHVAHKEQSGFAMIDDVVNLVGSKFILYRNGYSAIGKCSQKRHSPIGTVATTQGYFVALLYTAIGKENVQFFDFAGYIVVL